MLGPPTDTRNAVKWIHRRPAGAALGGVNDGGGTLDDLTYCAVFLAAEDAGYLTGQILQPNGGWVMP